MIEAEEIKLIMHISQAAERVEKRGVADDCLVEQIGRLQQSCFRETAKGGQQKTVGARVKIISNKICGGPLLHGHPFTSRNFGSQSIYNRLRDFRLDCKHV